MDNSPQHSLKCCSAHHNLIQDKWPDAVARTGAEKQ